MTIEDVYKKYDSVLYPQMYSLALVKDFMKKTFDMAVKDCNEYYQNELDEVYKNYADRLKDVLKENEKLKIKVAYRHEVQTMLEKRIEDLEEENAELKNKLEHRNCLDCSNHSSKLRMRNLELEKENKELKGEADSVLDNWCKGNDPCPHLKKRDEQLNKAKELLRYYFNCFKNDNKYTLSDFEVVEDTEQFLSEVDKCGQ